MNKHYVLMQQMGNVANIGKNCEMELALNYMEYETTVTAIISVCLCSTIFTFSPAYQSINLLPRGM